eukprot:jgi/Mesvir1/20764/Mv12769-RA.1
MGAFTPEQMLRDVLSDILDNSPPSALTASELQGCIQRLRERSDVIRGRMQTVLSAHGADIAVFFGHASELSEEAVQRGNEMTQLMETMEHAGSAEEGGSVSDERNGVLAAACTAVLERTKLQRLLQQNERQFRAVTLLRGVRSTLDALEAWLREGHNLHAVAGTIKSAEDSLRTLREELPGLAGPQNAPEGAPVSHAAIDSFQVPLSILEIEFQSCREKVVGVVEEMMTGCCSVDVRAAAVTLRAHSTWQASMAAAVGGARGSSGSSGLWCAKEASLPEVWTAMQALGRASPWLDAFSRKLLSVVVKPLAEDPRASVVTSESSEPAAVAVASAPKEAKAKGQGKGQAWGPASSGRSAPARVLQVSKAKGRAAAGAQPAATVQAPSAAYGSIRQVFRFLRENGFEGGNGHAREGQGGPSGSIGAPTMASLGAITWSPLCDVLIEGCLRHAVTSPETSGSSADVHRRLMQATRAFEDELAATGLLVTNASIDWQAQGDESAAPASATLAAPGLDGHDSARRLTKYVSQMARHVAEKKREEVLTQARAILLEGEQGAAQERPWGSSVTAQVSDGTERARVRQLLLLAVPKLPTSGAASANELMPDASGGGSKKAAELPTSGPSQGGLLFSPCRLPTCVVTRAACELVELMHKTLRDACEDAPASAAARYQATRDCLQLFRAFRTLAQGSAGDTLAPWRLRQAALHHNDALYLAYHCLLGLPLPYRARLPDPLCRVATFVDQVPLLRQLAAQGLQHVLARVEQDGLMQAMDSAGGLGNLENDKRWAGVQRAQEEVARILRSVSSAWAPPLLPPHVHARALARLLDAVASRVCEGVLRLDDISVTETERVCRGSNRASARGGCPASIRAVLKLVSGI